MPRLRSLHTGVVTVQKSVSRAKVFTHVLLCILGQQRRGFNGIKQTI